MLTVPGADSEGLVAPRMTRPAATTPLPSQICTASRKQIQCFARKTGHCFEPQNINARPFSHRLRACRACGLLFRSTQILFWSGSNGFSDFALETANNHFTVCRCGETKGPRHVRASSHWRCVCHAFSCVDRCNASHVEVNIQAGRYVSHHGHDRAGGHVRHEGREERLGHEILVVLLEESLICIGTHTILAILLRTLC